MQLLPSLMLDRVWIVLEPLHMAPQLLIFPLQRPQFPVERLRVHPLLVVTDQPVTSENNVISKPQRQHRRARSRDLAARGVRLRGKSAQRPTGHLFCWSLNHAFTIRESPMLP